MTTKTRKLTKTQCEKALQVVAKWMGEVKFYGPLISEEPFKCGPCPTGEEAARSGLGPMLMMDYEGWYGPARPAIVLEGGPYDWAMEAAWLPELKALGIFAEPIAGYALGLYPGDD